MGNIPILTGADQFHLESPQDLDKWTRHMAAQAALVPGAAGNAVDPAIIPPVETVYPDRRSAALAMISVGTWVADCPNDKSSYYVTPGWPMFCIYCGNFDIGNKWRRVVFPPFWEELQEILSNRAARLLQNYRGEPIELIRAEDALGRDLNVEEMREFAKLYVQAHSLELAAGEELV